MQISLFIQQYFMRKQIVVIKYKRLNHNAFLFHTIYLDIFQEHMDRQIGRYKITKILKKQSYQSAFLVESPECLIYRANIYQKQHIDYEKFLEKVQSLSDINQNNIQKIKDCFLFEYNENLAIIYQNNLESTLDRLIQKKMDEKEKLRIIKEIVDGVKYLHQKNIIHKNLRLENIFLDLKKTVKISMPSIQNIIEFNDREKQNKQNKVNLCDALEIVKDGLYSKQTDIWSLGILFLKLLIGKNKFHMFEERRGILCELSDFPSQDTKNMFENQKYLKLIEGMLEKDSNKRLKIQEISEIITDLNFKESFFIEMIKKIKGQKRQNIIKQKQSEWSEERLFLPNLQREEKQRIRNQRRLTQTNQNFNKLIIWFLIGVILVGVGMKVFYLMKDNGKCIMDIGAGNLYEGDCKDGDMHGKGIIHFASGNKFLGQFKNDKGHGKAIYYHKKQSKYVGDCENGTYHGNGTLYFANGDSYIGQFQSGKANGKGIYHVFEEEYSIQADFINGTYSNEKIIFDSQREGYVDNAIKIKHDIILIQALQYSEEEKWTDYFDDL